jgi:hypothetical protein
MCASGVYQPTGFRCTGRPKGANRWVWDPTRGWDRENRRAIFPEEVWKSIPTLSGGSHRESVCVCVCVCVCVSGSESGRVGKSDERHDPGRVHSYRCTRGTLSHLHQRSPRPKSVKISIFKIACGGVRFRKSAVRPGSGPGEP